MQYFKDNIDKRCYFYICFESAFIFLLIYYRSYTIPAVAPAYYYIFMPFRHIL